MKSSLWDLWAPVGPTHIRGVPEEKGREFLRKLAESIPNSFKDMNINTEETQKGR